MAKLAGYNSKILVSTDDVTYYEVAGMSEYSAPEVANTEECTSFGSGNVERKQLLNDNTYSMSGFRDLTDTNGQVAIRTAMRARSSLYVKVLEDGTNGWTQEVIATSFEVSPAVDNVVPLSIELEGTGAITEVP